MADVYMFATTVYGNSTNELLNNMQAMLDRLRHGVSTDAHAQDEAETSETAAEQLDRAMTPGRKRGRPPGSTAAASSTNGAGTSPEKSVEDMRQEATDILKACWGKKNSPGAEKVVALQKKFGVTRFGEVADDKVPSLLQAAVALQKELAGEPAGSDTGPF